MSSIARIVSLTVLTALIIILGMTFLQVVTPFLLPLFLAGVVSILCQPIFRYFIGRTHNRVRVAAGLTTAVLLSVLLIPLLVGTLIASLQLYTLTVEKLGTADWTETFDTLQINLVAKVQPYLPEKIDPAEVQQNVRRMLKLLAERSLGLAGTTLNKTLNVLGSLVMLMMSLLMFIIALYYFLADGPALITAAEGLIPVHIEYQRQLRSRFALVVRTIVLATFMAAIAQGLTTAATLYVIGWQVDSPVLRHFFIIALVGTLAAVIPLAGNWLVWGPCAVWLAFQGNWTTAILLTLFGSMVIGTMDNVIRTYLLQSDARLHPLLAFVSVLGGLQAMGLWGVFIGPIVASCLHALVQIFNSELREFSKIKFAFVTQKSAGGGNLDAAALEQPGVDTKTHPATTAPGVEQLPAAADTSAGANTAETTQRSAEQAVTPTETAEPISGRSYANPHSADSGSPKKNRRD